MESFDRWWVRSLLAMLFAWLGVLVAGGVWSAAGYPWIVETEVAYERYDLPSERVLQVPFGAWYTAEESISSTVPMVQLREYAPGEYELLYWGNPVRPRYTYRVLNIMNGDSVLRTSSGSLEPERHLLVTSPVRKDGRLPLQPAQKLGRLSPSPGGYCSVRVEVLASENNAVLCWKEYLLRCPEDI